MKDITISIAKQNDAKDIAIVGALAFYDAFAHLFNNQAELADYLTYTYSVDKIRRSIRKENNVYFLAVKDGITIGFAKLKRHSLNDLIDSGAQMELQKIYVLTEYQGHGAGAALLAAIKEFAAIHQPEHIWLDTHISNDKAIRVYEKHGFKKIGSYFFTIGTQTFEYHIMDLPIELIIPEPCQI